MLDAINEVEVFRCVDLPWNNAAMRELANAAARGARVTPVLGSEPPTSDEAGDLKRHVALVVIDNDADASSPLDTTDALLDDEQLVEEISIDGMCGVY